MKLNLGYIVIGVFIVLLLIICFAKKSVYEGLDDASLIRAAETRQEDYLKSQDKYWDNRKFPQSLELVRRNPRPQNSQKTARSYYCSKVIYQKVIYQKVITVVTRLSIKKGILIRLHI